MNHNKITAIIIDAAMKVHSTLGHGLLEQAYHACLAHELRSRGLKTLSEVAMPIVYEGVTIEVGYRLDLLVENVIIVELKSVNSLAPIHSSQLLTYLRLSKKPLGLLLNFGQQRLKDGIVRLINSPLCEPPRSSA